MKTYIAIRYNCLNSFAIWKDKNRKQNEDDHPFKHAATTTDGCDLPASSELESVSLRFLNRFACL